MESETVVVIKFRFEGEVPEDEIDFTDLVRDTDNLVGIDLFTNHSINPESFIKRVVLTNLQTMIRKVIG